MVTGEELVMLMD